MNTNQIQKILQNNVYTRDVFAGVYPRDRMPRIVKNYPRAYVCNTDPHDQDGEHWVAIYLDRDGTGEYFDAYGLPPMHARFVNFLNKNCAKSWTHNDQQLQGLTSHVCGQYCLFYLLHRCRGYPMMAITQMFGSNWENNDFLVHEFIVDYCTYI